MAIGGYLLVGVAMVFVFAGFFPGLEPENIAELQPFRHATPDFPLGSDLVGRNVWRLLIEGGRGYLPVVGAAAAIPLAIGWALGGLAARMPPFAAPVRWGAALLSVYPGVWWAMIV